GVPFDGESFMAILTQHITAEPTPPGRAATERGRALPPGIEEIIVKAMKKEADQRYQSMEQLVGALVTVYRNLAGSGMSSYLPAAGGPSQRIGGVGSSTPAFADPAFSSTQIAGSVPPGPRPVPGSAPYPAQVEPSDGSSSFVAAPRRRAGLLVVV